MPAGRPLLPDNQLKHPRPALQFLKPTHLHMATLVAAGMRDTEVAAICRCSAATVGSARRSPLFQAEVAKHVAALRTATSEQLVDRLQREGIPSVERMVSLRDTAKDQRLQGDMAKELLSYSASKAVQKTEHTEERRVVLDATELLPMLAVMAEDNPDILTRFRHAELAASIDAEPVEMADFTELERPEGVRALGDLVAAYESAEADEAGDG